MLFALLGADLVGLECPIGGLTDHCGVVLPSSCVDELSSFQGRKRLDGSSHLLLSQPKVVEAL